MRSLGALVSALVLFAVFGCAASVAAPLLTVDRSGGFAGTKDHLVIQADGSGSNVDRAGKRVRIGAGQTRAVRVALKQAAFPALRSSYGPIGGGSADGYVADLRSGGHLVHVTEGSQALPARLMVLWLAIDKLLYSLR
jgi:hypothetical protein